MIRRDAPLRWSRAWLLLLLAALLCLPPTPLAADEQELPPGVTKERAGTLAYRSDPEPPVAPDDPLAAQRILQRQGGLDAAELDWHGRYVEPPGAELGRLGRATLDLANDKTYGRTQAVHDLKAGGERVRPLVRNFDIGRHEILKHLYHRAMIVANDKLTAEGLSPIQKVQAVNAGGTGDYTRDQDITVFAGDEVREKAFFDAVEQVARDELKLTVDVKKTGGIDFPDIEATFFPGNNDLPDARFATDVEEFHLRYQVAIAKQAADAEAYKGGGADIEVKGRRLPGKMYVQQFTWSDKGPVYVAETPQNFREARSIFTGTPPERWQRFEHGAHIFSDFVQGRQHATGADHDVTKGPLKYAGRAIEHVCALKGFKPWPDLKPKDRTALLRQVWPQFDPKTVRGARVLKQIADALDHAVFVKGNKKLRPRVSAAEAHGHEAMALRFLATATAATTSEMARDLLYPPAFDTKTMRRLAGDAWDRMTPEQRFEYARARDKTFRAATGRAAMENLLVTMGVLRAMDFENGKPARRRPGARAVKRMLGEAASDIRLVLELASQYAEAWARKQQTNDPRVHAECDEQLAKVRAKLVHHCPDVPKEMPSLDILRRAAADGPRAVLDLETSRDRRWFSPEMQEVKKAFGEYIKQAFPTTADQYREFRKTLDGLGEHKYLKYTGRRLYDEAVQWDTLADLLTLVEMYQGEAATWDYLRFLSINLASRIHWSVGPMIQAFTVHDEDPVMAEKKANELGKSLVFVTLSRVVPWAASAKIAFDVGRGLVVVTVGWSVGQANKATIDALYTGEAGRTNPKAAGTVLGRMRDSGICVLHPSHVRQGRHPKTKALVISVDRDKLYRDFFRQWTDVDADEVPRSRPPRGNAASFTMAHDRFVRVLVKQAEQVAPAWIRAPGMKRFLPLRLTEKEVQDALGRLHPAIRRYVETKVDQVLAKTAGRSYRSYMEKEGVDVIREGLANRFSADFLAGLIQHWNVRLTAQALAARDIERTAVYSDWREVAKRLHKSYVPSPQRLQPLEMRLEGGRWRAVRRTGGTTFTPAEGDGPGLSFDLDARVDGVPMLGGAAYDGSQPLRVSAVLRGTGETADNERPIKIEVKPGKLRKIRTIGEEQDLGPVGPGDLVEDLVVVRALAADGEGPELARVEIPLKIVLPTDGKKRAVPLWTKTERFRDGRIKHRYTYFKRFRGMPADWPVEYGEVYHGPYEDFHGDGKTVGGRRHYTYGTLHGKYEDFNLEGKVVREVPYVRGVRQGSEIRHDPGGKGKLVIEWAKGKMVRRSATNERGQPHFRMTYRWIEGDRVTRNASGEAERWWPNGNRRWRGRYENAEPVIDSLGGPEAEDVLGKTGSWEWFHENGMVRERTTFVKGIRTGDTQSHDEKGQRISEGRYANGLRDGIWKTYYPSGALKSRESWLPVPEKNTSVRHGPCLEVAETGYATRKMYRRGVQHGPASTTWPNGKTHGETEYRKGLQHGLRREFFRSGKPKREVPFVDGREQGAFREWDIDDNGSHFLHITGRYANGELDGPYVERDAQGRVSTEGAYVEGRRDGTWTEHIYEAGGKHSTSVTIYKDGEQVGSGR